MYPSKPMRSKASHLARFFYPSKTGEEDRMNKFYPNAVARRVWQITP